MHRSALIFAGALSCFAIALAGCGKKKTRVAAPPPAPPVGATERGVASWYGHPYHGRKTASGEVYDMYAMTACHPSLPFGSIVRVVNLRNHKTVVVRITDRGDLVDEGRVIDLSYGAAKKLGMTMSGLARVELQVLTLGKDHTPVNE